MDIVTCWQIRFVQHGIFKHPWSCCWGIGHGQFVMWILSLPIFLEDIHNTYASQQPIYYYFVCLCCSVSASVFMLGRLVYRLAMHAGSCTVWNMVSSPTVWCLQAVVLRASLWLRMIPLTHSSVRLGLANMYLELSLLTWNQMLLVGTRSLIFRYVSTND